MTTRRSETVAVGSRSTTGRQVRKGTVRVWGEVGITVAVTDSPPQFVRVTFGHERMCPDDDESITRTERRIHRKNEEVVNKRAQELVRLIAQMNSTNS